MVGVGGVSRSNSEARSVNKLRKPMIIITKSLFLPTDIKKNPQNEIKIYPNQILRSFKLIFLFFTSKGKQ